ncbi:MAG: DUF2786 domain-containing protein [Cyanobacteria bacterium REEB67]|nr:DUF2786 domain-containing protein [Cyanobacteria bacterium REEB67]
MSESPPGIAQKIIKLLALAEGNKNEHERATAMKLALDLLAKHNLDLDALSDNTADPNLTTVSVNLRPEPWIRSILFAVCKLYYTRYYIRTYYSQTSYTKKQEPIFVGTEANINVSIEMSGFLIRSIRQESNQLFATPYERRSFRLGAAEAIYMRACAMVAAEKAEAANTPLSGQGRNSLIILRNKLEKANDDYMHGLNLGRFKSRGTYYDGGAYGMGESYGQSVDLGRSSKPKAITMRD